ncbi:MAG TPA: hypothetical protein VM347_21345 [Nonomuraea sp.]|nr:hypothetical protein [Nonomuraea sp.]
MGRTILMNPRLLVPVLATVLLGTSCGNERTGATQIQEDTAAVVKAMNAKDYQAARRALATLDADLAAAGRLDQLEAATIAELRAGVATLKADLALVSPLPTLTPTARLTTPAPARGDDNDKGGGKKHDKDD